MPRDYTPKPLPVRFWPKVDTSGDCWLWTGTLSDKGYGAIRSCLPTGPRYLYAHRVAYELTYGPIPPGLFVCHHCDNPACVRPEHLFLGTALDNTRDMMRKGRGRKDPACGDEHYMRKNPERIQRGDDAHNVKLTSEQVRTIRHLRAEGMTHREIAARVGTTRTNIGMILQGKTWGHLD